MVKNKIGIRVFGLETKHLQTKKMKRVYTPTGFFENEVNMSESESNCYMDLNEPRFRCRRQPVVEITKTCPCYMSYEIEDGDKNTLNNLEKQYEESGKLLKDGVISQIDAMHRREKYFNFLDKWDKAIEKNKSVCEGVYYVEVATNGDEACSAHYKTRDVYSEQMIPHPIGQPLKVDVIID